jgi:hypothetical protein
VPVAPEKFVDIITRHRPKEIDEPSADEEDDEERHARRGNPHQLSKKEKALRRVLSKL